MNSFDQMMAARIQSEYELILPSSESLERIKSAVKVNMDSVNKHRRISINQLAKIAVIAIVVTTVFIGRYKLQAAFQEMYQHFFENVENHYEENTNKCVKPINKAIKVEGGEILLDSYVVTDRGLEIKVKPDEKMFENFYGINISARDGNCDLDNMSLLKCNGYYLAIFEYDDKWYEDKKVLELEMSYAEDSVGNDIRTKTVELTFEFDNILNSKTIEVSDNVLGIKNIIIGTWCVEVEYEKTFEEAEIVMASIGNNYLAFLGKTEYRDMTKMYYELPNDLSGTITFEDAKMEGNKVDSTGDAYAVDISKAKEAKDEN